MSDCFNCEQILLELERVNQALAEKVTQLAEAKSRIKQLEDSAMAAFDPDHKFVELGEPFENRHIGQPDEEEREQGLADQLPDFQTLFKDDALKAVDSFLKQKARYGKFSSYKKWLFWHFWKQYETMLEREPAAKQYFKDVKRGTELLMILNLADIQNDPTSSNDCWLASEELVKDDGYARFQVAGLRNKNPFAHRIAAWLKFSFASLTTENQMQASHLCDNPLCLRHVYPESGTVNNSRKPCRQSGCAKDCEHEPKCQFQDYGIFNPCRSNPDLDECICDENCFQGVVRKKPVINELDSDEEQPKKKRQRRQVNLDGWVAAEAELTDDMLEQNLPEGRKHARLYFSQRQYSYNHAYLTHTAYKCFRHKGTKCTGTAKIEEGMVKETRPHVEDCDLVEECSWG